MSRIATAALLFLIAVSVRIWFSQLPNYIAGDQLDYLQLAENLRTHGVLGDGDVPKAHRPPLYPAVIATLGRRGTLALQIAAGGALAPLIFFVALRLVAPASAILAGLAMALAPMSSRYCSLFMTETLFTVLVVLGTFFWMLRKPAFCGVCFGLATLMRAVMFPFLLLLPLLAWKRAYRRTLVISGIAVLVIAPWTLRNFVVVHQIVPIASAGWGSNLFQGTLNVPSRDPWPAILQQRAGDTEAALLRRGLQRIRENPVGWLAIRARQYPLLFVDRGEYVGAWAEPFFLAGNLAVLVLAVAGAWKLRPGPELWAFPAFIALSQLPMWTESRYTLPIVPFLIVLAAGCFAGKSRRLRARVLARTEACAGAAGHSAIRTAAWRISE